MPLRARLLLAYLAVAVVLVGGGGVLFQRQLRAGLLASMDTALRVRADEVEQAVPEAGSDLNFQDDPQRLATPREAFTQVFDPAGTLVEASEAVGPRPLLSPLQLTTASGAPMRLTLRRDGEDLRLLAVPVARHGGTWVVVVGSSLEPATAALTRVRQGLVVGGVILLLAGGLGVWLLAGAALRPMERMRREAAVLHQARDLAAPIEVPATHDELAALAGTLNDLLGGLQAALQRQRQLVADAGHELRGPLTVLRGELELAGRPGRSRAELADAVANATVETDRLARLADNLLLLASRDEGTPLVQPCWQRLAPVLGASLDAARRRASEQQLRLHLEVDDGLVAAIDADRLRQAVDNLLDNALRVAPPQTAVTLRARNGHQVVVEVIDAGPGFPEAFLPYAFERFRRADPARTRAAGGAGLGLAIVQTIAEAHNGRAEAINRPEGGATVRILLPVSRPAAETHPR